MPTEMERLEFLRMKALSARIKMKQAEVERRGGVGAQSRAESDTLAQRRALGGDIELSAGGELMSAPPQVGASLTGPVTGFQRPSVRPDSTFAQQIPAAAPEDVPAIMAGLATLPFGGPAAAVPAVAARQAFVQSAPRALQSLAGKFAPLAQTTAAAAAGGGAGGALVPGEKGSIDAALDGAIEQGIVNPIAHMTLGLGKFLLAPGGQALKAQTQRLVEFARKEGLFADPAALLSQEKVSQTMVPSLVSEFSKKFLGSRVFSLGKMRAMANHMSSDPEQVGNFMSRVVDKISPTELNHANHLAAAGLARIARGTSSEALRRAEGAAAGDIGQGLKILFDSPSALAGARRVMTRDEIKAMAQTHVQNMMRRADEGGFLSGDKLARELAENRDTLKQVMPANVLDRLENFAVYLKAHAGAPAAAAENRILDPGTMGATAILGGAMALDPTTISGITVALGSAVASQVFNPQSVTARWLTTGVPPAARATAEALSTVPLREALGAGARGLDQLRGGPMFGPQP